MSYFPLEEGEEVNNEPTQKVTIDFSNYHMGAYDLSVPIYLPLKTLIPLIIDSLGIDIHNFKTKLK